MKSILTLFVISSFAGLAGEIPVGQVSPVSLILTQLASADAFFKAGNLQSAQEEYARVAANTVALQHHRREAQECLNIIKRRQAGLPASDSASHRAPPLAIHYPKLTLYVSPQGNDANAGSPEKPVATLGRARELIRALKKEKGLPAGGVAVVIHGGEYRVTRSFRLGAEDSGTEPAPIIFQAAPGEAPRFRGGVRLRGFRTVQDAAALERLPRESVSKIVELDLKSAGATNLLPLELGGFASGRGFKTHPAHELFFNGQAMQLARGPNEGFLRIKDVAVKDGTKGYDRQGSKTGKFHYSDERPNRWRGEPDLLLYGYWFWDWADSYERVASIDTEQRLITLAQPWHNYGFSIGAPFYAINALCELDKPGEYYLDRAHGKLFFYPPSDPNAATVELSLLAGPMLEMENVSHVRFENLTWELGSADAIVIRSGTNCLLAGCTVRQFAGNAIEIRGGAKHGLLSCDIYSMGRGGAIVSGGDRKSLTPGGHFIENCDIRDLSRIDHTYTPAVALSGVGDRITHNRLHDVLSSAMRVNGNDHAVEFNEIFNAVTESDDQGGADMFGNPTFRGNVYRFNYWHHIGNWRGLGEQPKCGQAGIRLDDAISGTLIYGNIFERCSAGKLGFGGVQIHGGKDNILDNNLFIDCAAAISFSPWNAQRWQETAAKAKASKEIDWALYAQRYPELARLAESPNTNHIYRTLTVRCGEFLRRAPKSVEVLAHTALTAGELSPKPDNQLWNFPGFAPIPLNEIGLYADAFRTNVKPAARP